MIDQCVLRCTETAFDLKFHNATHYRDCVENIVYNIKAPAPVLSLKVPDVVKQHLSMLLPPIKPAAVET